MSLDRQRIDGVKTLLSEGWKWSLSEGWKNPKAPAKSETKPGPMATIAGAPVAQRKSVLTATEYDNGTVCTADQANLGKLTYHEHWVVDNWKFCGRCGQRVIP